MGKLWDVIRGSFLERLELSCDFVSYMSKLEEAYFYYLNHCGKPDDDNERKKFFSRSYASSKNLRKLSVRFAPREDVAGQYERYRRTTGVCGCAIVDDSGHYLLVSQGFNGRPWTPPGGKLKSETEDHYLYAVREVKEETGFKLPGPQQLLYVNGRVTTFLQTNVSLDRKFRPEVRHEIERLAWVSIDYLLSDRLTDEENAEFYKVVEVARRLRGRIRKRPSRHGNPKKLIWNKWKFSPNGREIPDI